MTRLQVCRHMLFVGIVEGLESLHAAGSPPQFLIIDDGWQLTGTDEQVAAAVVNSGLSTAAPTAPDASKPVAGRSRCSWVACPADVTSSLLC